MSPIPMIKEERILLGKFKVNVAEAGDGFPIIFLHNGGGFWQSWQSQLTYFSTKYKVYGIDWPGCGESDYPDELLTLSVINKVLIDFIDIKGLNSFHLVGNCIGASLALQFAIDHPQMVKKLVVMNVCPGDLMLPPLVNKKKIAQLDPNSKRKARLNFIVKFVTPNIIVRRVFPKILFGKSIESTDPLFRKYRIKQGEKNQKKSRVDLFFSAHSYNLNPIIEGKTIPDHLLLWGEENRVAPLNTYGHATYNLLKSEEFHVISNAGHLCAYEKPNEINAILDAYFETSN